MIIIIFKQILSHKIIMDSHKVNPNYLKVKMFFYKFVS